MVGREDNNKKMGPMQYALSKYPKNTIFIQQQQQGNNTIWYNYVEDKIIHTFSHYISIYDNVILEHKSDNSILYKILDDDDIPEEEQCIICYKRTLRKKILIPCGHTQYCKDCITKIKTCSLCRKNISNIIDIF